MEWSRFRLGLRGRLVALAAGVVTPFAVYAVVEAQGRSQALANDARARAADVAQRIAARVADRNHEIERVLATLAQGVVPDAAHAAENSALLERVTQRLAFDRLTIFVADAKGRVRGRNSGRGTDSATVADREWFRQAIATGQPATSEAIRLRPEPGPWGITVAVPIHDAKGTAIGVVAAARPLATFQSLVDARTLPAGSIVTLFDGGVVLARSFEPDAFVGRDLADAPLVRAGSAGRNGAIEGDWVDGVARLTTYTEVPGSRWQVYVGVPSAAVYGPSRRQLTRDLGLVVVILLAAIAVATFIGRRIVAPLHALTEDALAVAGGEPGRRTRPSGGGEVATLAAAFDTMADRVAMRTAALEGAERRSRELFAGSPMPMWATDRESLAFVAVNDAAIRLYGWPRDAWQGMRWPQLLAAPDGAVHTDGPARHRTADGRLLDVELTSSETILDGRPARLTAIRDVSAQLAAERALAESQEQLRQSQKMEAVGRLAGGIAHDFNNLLTGMLGHCDLALAELPAEHPARDEVRSVRAAAQRATALTKQILAFGRRSVLQPTAVDAVGAMAGLDRMLRRLIGEHVTIDTRLDPAAGHVFADPAQLEQVLLNLAVNARDAMPAGGTLTLGVAPRDLAPADAEALDLPAGRYVAFSVVDTGIGMDATVRARLFEPFFTTKPRGEGTGLGLATAYGIVQQAGGRIQVASEPGRGSAFTVLLPRHDAPAAAPAAPAPAGRPLREAPRANGESILVAEDEAGVRALIGGILERLGYRVVLAGDGAAALAAAQRDDAHFDLLLTDVVMPQLNGRELAERLHRRHPSLPVLFMSGYTEDPALKQAIAADRVAYLEKPFTASALAARVREVLDAARTAPAEPLPVPPALG